ncbi:MAG TPA: CoA transferase [Burkholderiales bacterium]|jgi:crotonobetainyl-CoA:carnitine CoA-transferase CaiB-like acyl-CoA transferase|nr:CoA transferase [Burkholderiales bacterium]
MAGGPLEGVRVVDLTSVVVGPLATQILADHGADVIKVESQAGDLVRNMNGKSVTPGMGAKFLHLNRNKRSVVLDLKKPAGHAALLKILSRADVMIWNVRPPTMARLKLAYEDVRAVNAGIIYCGMFGFGQDGRYRDKPAYDTIIQGSGGMAALNHRAMGEPRFVPMVVADKVVGLIAVQMIAMALYRRAKTGAGCSIEIPMFENLAKFVLEEHMYLKTFDPPLGDTGDPRLLDPLNRPLPTQDGWICISANTNEQAFAFFDAIGRPELKIDPRFSSVPARFAHVKEYFEIRMASLRTRTTAEWLEIFDRADVPAMPYHTLDSLLEDPHLQEVGFFEMKQHPTEGRTRSMRLPNKWSCGTRREWTPAPKLGQQSVEVLREIGYSDAEIDALIAEGATLDGSLAKG